MARTKDNTTTLILGGIALGAAGLLLFNRNQFILPKGSQGPYQNFPQVPPQPPKNTPDFQAWVNSIINLYGSVSDLWEPGGPFHKDGNDGANYVIPPGSDFSNVAGINATMKDVGERRRGSRADTDNPAFASLIDIEAFTGKTMAGLNNERLKIALRNIQRDPDQVADDFGLYGIEFGKWMTEYDRINYLVATLAAMDDMARVLGVPVNKMGMNMLLLALGSRGHGGRAAAFYMHRPYYAIGLVKSKPVDLKKIGMENAPTPRPSYAKTQGSFAHEWGHFTDYMLGRRYFNNHPPSGGRTLRHTVNANLLEQPTIRGAFERVIRAIWYNKNGEPTKYIRTLQDQNLGDYWFRRNELWARIVERWFHWKFKEMDITNDWAVAWKQPWWQPPEKMARAADRDIRAIILTALQEPVTIGTEVYEAE